MLESDRHKHIAAHWLRIGQMLAIRELVDAAIAQERAVILQLEREDAPHAAQTSGDAPPAATVTSPPDVVPGSPPVSETPSTRFAASARRMGTEVVMDTLHAHGPLRTRELATLSGLTIDETRYALYGLKRVTRGCLRVVHDPPSRLWRLTPEGAEETRRRHAAAALPGKIA